MSALNAQGLCDSSLTLLFTVDNSEHRGWAAPSRATYHNHKEICSFVLMPGRQGLHIRCGAHPLSLPLQTAVFRTVSTVAQTPRRERK